MLGAGIPLYSLIVGCVLVGALVLAWVIVRKKGRAEADETMDLRPSRRAPSEGLASRIRGLFGPGSADPWAELEELLVKADVGPATAARIVTDVRPRFREGDDPSALVGEEVREILGEDQALALPDDGLGIGLGEEGDGAG